MQEFLNLRSLIIEKGDFMKVCEIKISEHGLLEAYLHAQCTEYSNVVTEKRPAIIVCPGGSYWFCSQRENESPALAFLNMGLQVFVLTYSTKDFAANKQPLVELATAVKLVRENSEQWGVDPQKIVVCGFSAGGHLAGSLGVHWEDIEVVQRSGASTPYQIRPDGMLLCYPVITAGEYRHSESIRIVSKDSRENIEYWSLEQNVNSRTPPTFLWHTMDDDVVPVENSVLFAQSLHRHGVECECHLFGNGQHGMSVATKEVITPSPSIHKWLELFQMWLTQRFCDLGANTF